jgi:hypothetical protein
MVNVYITVDTECSLGGAWENPKWKPVGPERSVLGRIDSKQYGVPLIMDILEENGLRATFFTEVLARDVVSSSELAAAYVCIRERGHDPQLHLHPVFHYYHLVTRGLLQREQLPASMDLIGSLAVQTQLELLQKGRSIFHEIFGSAPSAFRAGCYGASMATLDVLEQVGIRFDSSFNAAYLGSTCLMNSRKPANASWRHGSVWEIPVTTFETGAGAMRSLKPLEVSAVSFSEMQGVLNQAERLGQDTVIVMLHSFSFLKRADAQFLRMRPDHLVIGRFQRLCSFLRSNQNRFQVLTFSELPEPLESPVELPFPNLGFVTPALRKCVQAVNRIYWV